jgi:hypothetical protein
MISMARLRSLHRFSGCGYHLNVEEGCCKQHRWQQGPVVGGWLQVHISPGLLFANLGIMAPAGT